LLVGARACSGNSALNNRSNTLKTRWYLLPLLIVAAALIYDSGVFYSRWSRNRAAARAQAAKEAIQERKELDDFGGGELRIISFYAVPGTPARLCYGVIGAKAVRMEPAVDAVWPALTRCVQVSPRKTTEYRLIAEDEAGHSVTQSVTVTVHNPVK
jgi:hypothetical protein